MHNDLARTRLYGRILLREDRGKLFSCIHQLQPVCFDNDDERQTRQTWLPENVVQTILISQCRTQKDKISEQLDTLLITSSLSQSMEHLKNGALDNFYHHILGIKTRQEKYYANLDCEVITFFARWPNQSTSHVRWKYSHKIHYFFVLLAFYLAIMAITETYEQSC